MLTRDCRAAMDDPYERNKYPQTAPLNRKDDWSIQLLPKSF